MYQRFTKTETQASAVRSSTMENRDHSKNGAIPKSHTSKGNLIVEGEN